MNGRDYPELFDPTDEQQAADDDEALWLSIEAQADAEDEVTLSPWGPQEPPGDYRIFNRRQAGGDFRPLSEYFAQPAQPPAQVVTDPDGREWVKMPRSLYDELVAPLAGLGWVEGWYEVQP